MVEMWRERYVHIEVLFYFRNGDSSVVNDTNDYQRFTVYSEGGVGLYQGLPEFFREGKWQIIRMDVTQDVRLRMYQFAASCNGRAFNNAMFTNFFAGTRWIGSLLSGTFLGRWMGFGNDGSTYFCAQMMTDMLKHVYPDAMACYDSARMTPDATYSALRTVCQTTVEPLQLLQLQDNV